MVREGRPANPRSTQGTGFSDQFNFKALARRMLQFLRFPG